MKSALSLGVLVLLLVAALPAQAQLVYYVAPDGSDDNPGTIDEPLATIHAAHDAIAAEKFSDEGVADTIYVRAGTYDLADELSLGISGFEGARIYLWAYPGETPVLDFTENDDRGDRGVRLRADNWHIKGLVVQHAGDNGIHISGNDNVVEQVAVRYNGDSGLQLDSGASHNLILNVDSYENYDPQNNGENADGFAPKFDVGPGNVLRGCRAYRNSDDGFDMWNEDVSNGNGVRVEDSWAFENGVNRWGDPDFQGDGNGYKLGHGTGAHVLVRVVAWKNVHHGIDINGNLTGVTVYNSSGFDNYDADYYFDENNDAHVLRNNVSVLGNVRMDDVDDAFNTWNEGFSASPEDFVSLDTTGLAGPRQADGSLPETDFLRLAPESSLIDAGVDVGLPYAGAAPDLGAFEFGLTSGTAAPGPAAADAFALEANHPNPFRSATTITYSVARPSHVRLDVFDVTGRRVATLVDAPAPAGVHAVSWNASSDRAAGIYLARLSTPEGTATQTMVLLR